MRRKYNLNKMTFNTIYDLENCSIKKIESKSKVSQKTLYKLLDDVHPVISEFTAHQLASAYGFKVYDMIGDEV